MHISLFSLLCFYFHSDQSIPPLSSTMQKDSEDLDILTGFIKDQVAFEERIAQTHKEERVNCPNPETECVPPEYVYV